MPHRLPRRLQRFFNLCNLAEEETGVDKLLLLAVLDKESAGGEALRPKGPKGTGDWKPRLWHRYVDRADALTRFRHWRPSQDDYERVMRAQLEVGQTVPELCMPSDGLGFGRGLMQLDWADKDNEAFLAELMPDGTPRWQDAWNNIVAGAKKLQERILMFDGDEYLGACAYNARPDRIQRAVAEAIGSRHEAADRVTTGHNYGSDVIARRRHYQALMAIPPNGDEEHG